MEYRFRADNRELSFTANSRLVPVTIDATQTGFYRREITCDYVNAVHELYLDDIYEVLQENEGYLKEHGWIYLLSFSDIDRAVDTILAADQIYRRELEYNPQEFLSSYPAASVHVVWQRSKQEAEEHETWVNLTDIGVTGLHETAGIILTVWRMLMRSCVSMERLKTGRMCRKGILRTSMCPCCLL